jgi:uncharacterized tellurite resistance protein B-like protein
MLDSIKSFFSHHMTAEGQGGSPNSDDAPKPSEIQVAACALLLELAYADEVFTPAERLHLEASIQRHFDLNKETATELIALADEQRRRAVDLFQFTSLIAQEYDEAQKMVLLEAMWGLVYADGEVARHEAYLMRKVSKLLDVKPGFLAQARRRVEDGTAS